MKLADNQLFEMGLPGQPTEQLTPDENFDLLTSPLRRCIVRYLLMEERLRDRIELTTQIAENEPVEFTPLWVALTHSHLPRLADAGVIEYDIERETIDLTENREPLEALLDVIDEWGDR